MGYSPNRVKRRRDAFIYNTSTKLRLAGCRFWRANDTHYWPNEYSIITQGDETLAVTSSPGWCVIKAARKMGIIN